MELLDEIWSLIFREYLDLLDTLRCRRVSKRFKNLIDQLRPSELLIYGYDHSSYYYEAYTDYRDPKMWVQLPKSFNLEPNSSFQIVFANLKFLQFDMILRKEFNLELLNEFVLLERLYLNRVVLSTRKTLRLPRLQMLALRFQSDKENRKGPSSYRRIDYQREPRLVIDSKVKTLLGARSKLLVVRYPECIRHLRTSDCNEGALETEHLARFKNLRVLQSPLTAAILNSFQTFQDLEELHLDRYLHLSSQASKQLLCQLLDKNAELKRNVKVYFLFILMPNFNSLERSDYRHSVDEQISNYPKLADCMRDKFHINYDNLVGSLAVSRADLIRKQITFERGFPVDFFERFSNIKYVTCYIIHDDEQFIWFLGKCTKLTKLDLQRKFLSQSILDGLPVACRSLKELYIDRWFPARWSSDYVPREAALDPSPIYELRQLFKLTIGRDYAGPDKPFDFGILLEKCRYLASIYLKYLDIDKTQPNRYNVITYDKLRSRRATYTYTYEELKSNLSQIIESCRD